MVLEATDKTSQRRAAVDLALICGWRGLLFAVFGGGSMKLMRSAFLGLGLLLAVSAAQAQDAKVKADIPFDFVVGDRVMPAGEYIVGPAGSVSQAITISSGDRTDLTLTFACASSGPSKSTKLVFHALAGRYFLSQVWVEGYSQGRQLRMSKTETQLAKNGDAPRQFVLAANVTH
jgi:hypothetical protein